MADGGTTPGVILEPAGAGSSGVEDAAKKQAAQRDRLLEAVIAAGVTFFHDADGAAYAAVPGAGGSVSYYRVTARRFALVARALYGAANRRAVPGGDAVIPSSVSATAWAEAVPSFEAMALEGPTRAVDVRAVRQGRAVWLDLGRNDWQGVRVTAEGWRVVPRIEAPLIRPEGLRALPIPERSSSRDALADLARLLNVSGGRDGRDMKLTVAWATTALYPPGQRQEHVLPHRPPAGGPEQGGPARPRAQPRRPHHRRAQQPRGGV
jgi:hypothetical protein